MITSLGKSIECKFVSTSIYVIHLGDIKGWMMDNYQSKHQQMISGLQSHADYYGSFMIVMLSNHVGFLKANNAHK